MTENENLKKQITDDLSAVLKEAKSMGCKEVTCFRHIPLQNVETVIQALEEIQQYKAIGTIEEFKALKEKVTPKKRGIWKSGHTCCPTCERGVVTEDRFCCCCGQALKPKEI